LLDQGKQDRLSVSTAHFISFEIEECNVIKLTNSIEILNGRGTVKDLCQWDRRGYKNPAMRFCEIDEELVPTPALFYRSRLMNEGLISAVS